MIAIDPAQADEVYDHYATHQQPRRKARFAHFALGLTYRPRVEFVDDARPHLRAVARSGVRLVLCVNHINDKDQFVVAGALWRSPLRPLIGRIRVLAKHGLYTNPKQRANIDMMGGIPVFRARDTDPETAAAANRRMLAVCIERGAGGDAIAIFPEGTRNDGDPTVLQPLASGAGQIAAGIAARRPTALIPIAVAYQGDSAKRARVVFGDPVTVAATLSVPEITDIIRERLQATVDRAHSH
ncbi:1-acyl-sn-glycerol-3-phosphate acyltransferase [Williamsia sp. CHRR-6]|uniref:lysophospholipid acyltransferase family protein n=1 Tax=Williamsia sp. CHRR-6 TaxID=2835871 RepID=UPI001BD9FDF0|nr:1-acyl-sn-glycerol-3-phosphate acyltransferase [Williamsia sp. CHRR-6]MBT0567524.1 1-acyl-sn-glycerol-3-phosphate acyltransferase [Williamsia sp. CHRR-6]